MTRWSIVRLIWLRELRDQLRDRRTLFMIVVLPVFVYPLAGLGLMQAGRGRPGAAEQGGRGRQRRPAAGRPGRGGRRPGAGLRSSPGSQRSPGCDGPGRRPGWCW